ncbi:carbohydrate kinase family protein [Candidatus Desulfovibrio trichonymphae]|uniref:PfkB family kinase n=1 Tax=Candidatus Desulfovibrio trichonymphae TaxID=1725232 RepID=A0A1J1DR57_9BACT|nr:carbohydrate kinase family protein [Candidatus Desulfovibrio trichonymphae]BAV92335.1 PfkB family kinase [Candidatus Desulfovibrio trichonymphae]GHU97985.1 carbohydrate kinase [Deltaproteobacteria bacterium]
MSIYISGSLAFDRIMTFSGSFQDHILIDKLHQINVSFMVDRMDERRGGCAGNIAWSLALLGEKPVIVSSAGRDFDAYARSLAKRDLPLDGIRRDTNVFTSLCYITTDMNGDQITGFYPGAMALPSDYTFDTLSQDTDIAIVSPGNIDDMCRLPALYRDAGVPYIYDPGQQMPVLSASDLLKAVEGSFACITNDYELKMICKTTGKTENEMLGRTLWLVTTLGAQGALVRGADGTETLIPAAVPSSVVDPTGAGDAHRAGIVKGLAHGLPMPEAAKFGSVSASFALEHTGTQEHKFTKAQFKKRYEAVFGPMPIALS